MQIPEEKLSRHWEQHKQRPWGRHIFGTLKELQSFLELERKEWGVEQEVRQMEEADHTGLCKEISGLWRVLSSSVTISDLSSQNYSGCSFKWWFGAVVIIHKRGAVAEDRVVEWRWSEGLGCWRYSEGRASTFCWQTKYRYDYIFGMNSKKVKMAFTMTIL